MIFGGGGVADGPARDRGRSPPLWKHEGFPAHRDRVTEVTPSAAVSAVTRMALKAFAITEIEPTIINIDGLAQIVLLPDRPIEG